MSDTGSRILQHLAAVAAERDARRATPGLEAAALAVKTYQQQRFGRTHAALLASPRHGPAARFFLEELYGPRDFSTRDAQFARIVPTLVRMFPGEIVATVERLAAVHALSEQLDSDMARRLGAAPVTRATYVAAWQGTGRRADRECQIALVLEVGQALDRYTRNPLLRTSLRLMRGPARAAGMASLQQFLEGGFDAFAAMRGATEFLSAIERAERALIDRLFDPAAPAQASGPVAEPDILAQLP